VARIISTCTSTFRCNRSFQEKFERAEKAKEWFIEQKEFVDEIIPLVKEIHKTRRGVKLDDSPVEKEGLKADERLLGDTLIDYKNKSKETYERVKNFKNDRLQMQADGVERTFRAINRTTGDLFKQAKAEGRTSEANQPAAQPQPASFFTLPPERKPAAQPQPASFFTLPPERKPAAQPQPFSFFTLPPERKPAAQPQPFSSRVTYPASSQQPRRAQSRQARSQSHNNLDMMIRANMNALSYSQSVISDRAYGGGGGYNTGFLYDPPQHVSMPNNNWHAR
jgi:hypothetical protein